MQGKGWEIHMPALNLCGDNAAMVGAQAYYEFFSRKNCRNGFKCLRGDADR